MKRVAFKTVGCRLNQAETARMATDFKAAGWIIATWGTPCDAAIVHSCAITASAEQTSARLMRVADRMKPRPLTVLAGCAAEVAGSRLQSSTKADLIVSQAEKPAIAKLVMARLQDKSAPPPSKTAQGSSDTLPLFFQHVRAIVKIQDGCDFNCTYCIVPQARGRPVSRAATDILDDVRRLAEHGTREIMVTGANIGCYRHRQLRLPELLAQIESIDGIDRIRIGNIELSTAEKAVIDMMAGSTKLCRYLHFPLQSGDDGILQAMGRRYTARDYRRWIAYAASTLGDPGLGADIIVGFPGETIKAFANTKALVDDLPLSNLHVFPFSPRPGTRASVMGPPVSSKVTHARVAELIALGNIKKTSFAHRWLQRDVSVLVEKVSPRSGAQGWTSEYAPAVLPDHSLRVNTITRFTPDAIVDGVLTRNRPPCPDVY